MSRAASMLWSLELVKSECFNPHSHDHWWWRATLTRRKDGKYSLGIRQVLADGRTWRAQGLAGFRRGSALFAFLDAAGLEHAGVALDEPTWTGIADAIKPLDSRLCGEVRSVINGAPHLVLLPGRRMATTEHT